MPTPAISAQEAPNATPLIASAASHDSDARTRSLARRIDRNRRGANWACGAIWPSSSSWALSLSGALVRHQRRSS